MDRAEWVKPQTAVVRALQRLARNSASRTFALVPITAVSKAKEICLLFGSSAVQKGQGIRRGLGM